MTLLASDLSLDASAPNLALLVALGGLGAQPVPRWWRRWHGRSFAAVRNFHLPATREALAEAHAGRWQALRTSPLAPRIGPGRAAAAAARRPYGARSDPIDAFDFDELEPGAAPAHADFLWGAPALVMALLAGRAFAANGWDGNANDDRDVGDLPAVKLWRGGEPEQLRCVEGFLGERETQAMLDAGLMPLVSERGRNALRMQSITDRTVPPRCGRQPALRRCQGSPPSAPTPASLRPRT